MKIKLTLLLLLTGISAIAQKQFGPVNPNTSPEARKLLAYIYSIKGKNMISGQHTYVKQPDKHIDSVVAITGKKPALWGNDFIYNWKTDVGQDIVNESIKKYNEGYIICLMWHQGRPTDDPPYDWKKSIQADLTDEQWNELVTPNTELNKKWLAQIDKVAVWLKQLQDAKVPVLWRPYHEMNGVWFWWGDKKGKNGISKLWQMMYDRYTNYHKLNNLIWVWGANGPRDLPEDEAFPYKYYYPGAKYVDILGTDIYNADYEQKDYNELLQLAKGKPIALTEVGELPKAPILKAQPEWVWFMVWSNWLWTHNTHELVKEVYDNPKTITLDELSYK
ncbi:MAG: glycosyl hydrolase [Mucilaginibacter sp.]